MDGPQINQKIRYGYAKAAQKLGQSFELYRPAVPIDPISEEYFIGDILAVMSQDWTWMKANRYGNAVWFCCIDAQDSSAPLNAQIGNYLVGEKTFFVMSIEYQLPIQVVECNQVISIIRPSQGTGPGYIGYTAETRASSEVVMTAMPASVLIFGRGQMAKTNLPSDTNQPIFRILLPNIADVIIRTDDTIIDDQNKQYTVMECEMQEFGWRLSAQQVVNSR